MVTFVDSSKAEYGVEPICNEIWIAPSSYYEYKAHERDPDRLPDRIKRDMRLEFDIQRVWKDNFRVYGACKVWRQLLREGTSGFRNTLQRFIVVLSAPLSRRATSDCLSFNRLANSDCVNPARFRASMIAEAISDSSVIAS